MNSKYKPLVRRGLFVRDDIKYKNQEEASKIIDNECSGHNPHKLNRNFYWALSFIRIVRNEIHRNRPF